MPCEPGDKRLPEGMRILSLTKVYGSLQGEAEGISARGPLTTFMLVNDDDNKNLDELSDIPGGGGILCIIYRLAGPSHSRAE